MIFSFILLFNEYNTNAKIDFLILFLNNINIIIPYQNLIFIF